MVLLEIISEGGVMSEIIVQEKAMTMVTMTMGTEDEEITMTTIVVVEEITVTMVMTATVAMATGLVTEITTVVAVTIGTMAMGTPRLTTMTATVDTTMGVGGEMIVVVHHQQDGTGVMKVFAAMSR